MNFPIKEELVIAYIKKYDYLAREILFLAEVSRWISPDRLKAIKCLLSL